LRIRQARKIAVSKSESTRIVPGRYIFSAAPIDLFTLGQPGLHCAKVGNGGWRTDRQRIFVSILDLRYPSSVLRQERRLRVKTSLMMPVEPWH
jgi:hypothetical protein